MLMPLTMLTANYKEHNRTGNYVNIYYSGNWLVVQFFWTNGSLEFSCWRF